MRVREIEWTNYRRIPDGRITARNHIVLIGPNDTGKSSIVRALYLCLGMAHNQLQAALTRRDFTDPTVPLLIRVVLDGISDEDRAAFPDEITTGSPEVLTIQLEAVIDVVDPDQKTVRRFFPDGGHTRGPTTHQLQAVGFDFVPAARSLLRELGGANGGAVRSLLSTLDLTADAVALQAAADDFRGALAESKALTAFRVTLADALSEALPSPIRADEVRMVTEAEILQDPLSGVTVTVREGDHDVPLAEQSDGIRALSVLTLFGMSHKMAKIVAIDEPETHLHPTAQRAIARSLQRSDRQRILVTHSPSVIARMEPMDIVVFGTDRRSRQLDGSTTFADFEATVRYWSYRLIEPLTARHVALIEGPADRILVECVATLMGTELDRLGIALFELEGKTLFPLAYRLFGPAGFNLHVVGLIDEDARVSCADEIGVAQADLSDTGFVVCEPDLEGMYIDSLGAGAVIEMLLASGTVGERSLLDGCGAVAIGNIGPDALRQFCSKRKVAAAIAVARALDVDQAQLLRPLIELLKVLV